MYQNLLKKQTLEDNETKNKTRIDIEYEWEKIVSASISTLSRYQILW